MRDLKKKRMNKIPLTPFLKGGKEGGREIFEDRSKDP